ncbi:MAG: AraC family transcriptional regulator, partial [Bacteroidota bacterium]
MENQPSMGDQFLETIHKIIEDNIDNENFSVEDLAEGVGLSRSMLHRKLKKLTGKSANKLITETRLSKAKELLENDIATASEIAYKVGFNDPSYFFKVFKKQYKVSPGDIKKKGVIISDQRLEIPFLTQLGRRKLIFITLIIIIVISGGGMLYLNG